MSLTLGCTPSVHDFITLKSVRCMLLFAFFFSCLLNRKRLRLKEVKTHARGREVSRQ